MTSFRSYKGDLLPEDLIIDDKLLAREMLSSPLLMPEGKSLNVSWCFLDNLQEMDGHEMFECQ
jgi:hypothetical protein